MSKNILFIIPARGGSKGIPGKNIKPLAGKPLIYYSLEFARQFVTDDDICISTDSPEIAESVRLQNYKVPFLRPPELATDSVGTYEVLKHALNYYKNEGKDYVALILLQPTSPFRKKEDLENMLKIYNQSVEMVVSVNESSSNPYFNLFEEGKDGFLQISKGPNEYTTRQKAPKVYQYNGSIYVINTNTLIIKNSFREFDKVVKFEMDNELVDLDTPEDWKYAEYLAKWKI